MKKNMIKYGVMVRTAAGKLLEKGMKKEPGIDGILVTVGLCIIALLLCVVMKESMTKLIQDIVKALSDKAIGILGGVI